MHVCSTVENSIDVSTWHSLLPPHLCHSLTESADAMLVLGKHKEMMQHIKEWVVEHALEYIIATTKLHKWLCVYMSTSRYEDEVFQEWSRGVEEVAHINLKKPLLIRDEQTNRISLNFDPQVRDWFIICCSRWRITALLYCTWTLDLQQHASVLLITVAL